MNVDAVLTSLLASAMIAAVPLTLASVGEAIGERGGVLNLGLEGILLLAAFAGFWAALRADHLGIGLAVGTVVGALTGALFGLAVTRLGADQVVLGLALTLAGAGLSGFLYRETFGSEQPLLAASMGRPLAGTFDALPVIGPALFDQKWIVYVSWVIVALVAALLNRTPFGRSVRAVGEAPFAADAVGVPVQRVRLTAATLTGALTGLGGASLAVAELGLFRPGMTVGLGFVAIAMTMLGRWNPVRIAVAALAFGLLRSAGVGLQIAGVDVRVEFVQTLPYLGVILGLILFARGIRMPAALGIPYRRGTDS